MTDEMSDDSFWLPALIAFLVGGGVIAVAEYIGIVRGKKVKQVDTISDLWWWLARRHRWAKIPMTAGLGAFLVWLFVHLTWGSGR